MVEIRYCLIFYNEEEEAFLIGVFETQEKAKEKAIYYLNHVAGFCEYSCRYCVEEKEVSNPFHKKFNFVWVVYGWNENENFETLDMVESIYVLTKAKAKRKMKYMKKQYVREEWAMDQYEIDECLWADGFVRM